MSVKWVVSLFLTCRSSGIGIISRLLKVISGTQLVLCVDKIFVWFSSPKEVKGVVRCGEGVMYLTTPGHPIDIGLQLGKACYPCNR